MFYDHIIIDFEMNPVYPGLRERAGGLTSEILEFGAVRLDGSTLEVIDTFQSLVKPAFVRKVDSKISRLTGITTKSIAAAPSFSQVLSRFMKWVGPRQVRIHSWSSTDMFQLQEECHVKHIPFPVQLLDWLDLQAEYPRLLDRAEGECLGLFRTARMLGIPVLSNHCHEALYDAQITAKLLQFLMTGFYRMSDYRVHPITPQRNTMTYSVADVYGSKLYSLLERLNAKNTEELIHHDLFSDARIDSVLV